MKKFVKSLNAKTISWQGWTENKKLANLVADKRALGPLFESFKATEIGRREKVEEKELE